MVLYTDMAHSMNNVTSVRQTREGERERNKNKNSEKNYQREINFIGEKRRSQKMVLSHGSSMEIPMVVSKRCSLMARYFDIVVRWGSEVFFKKAKRQ